MLPNRSTHHISETWNHWNDKSCTQGLFFLCKFCRFCLSRSFLLHKVRQRTSYNAAHWENLKTAGGSVAGKTGLQQNQTNTLLVVTDLIDWRCYYMKKKVTLNDFIYLLTVKILKNMGIWSFDSCLKVP